MVTDFVQMFAIYVIGALILPMAWSSAGGISAFSGGIFGIEHTSGVLDVDVAFSFGIVTSIGLVAGACATSSIGKEDLP